MFKGEHSVILSTFIKLPVAIKTFVLSILSVCFTALIMAGSFMAGEAMVIDFNSTKICIVLLV